MSDKPAYIHHVNFPTTDPERTIEWYTKVFGMKYIKPKSNTKVVLMTRGNFDLHFTPVEEMDRMAPYHFAVEVEDWDGFLDHLAKLGIRHTRVITRPEPGRTTAPYPEMGIVGQRMPLDLSTMISTTPLDPAFIALVEQWIDQGAQ